MLLYEYVPNGKAVYYIYLNGKQIARVERVNGVDNKSFYHTDHLGSTRAITDAQGNVVGRFEYEPFGAEESHTGQDGTLTYTGKTEDDPTGLMYFNARYYDPTLGRFVTEDPAKDGGNWYLYGANNLIYYVDRDGRKIETTDRFNKNEKAMNALAEWKARCPELYIRLDEDEMIYYFDVDVYKENWMAYKSKWTKNSKRLSLNPNLLDKYSVEAWACVIHHEVNHFLNDSEQVTMNDELCAHIAEFEFGERNYGSNNSAGREYSIYGYMLWKNYTKGELKRWLWENYYSELSYN